MPEVQETPADALEAAVEKVMDELETTLYGVRLDAHADNIRAVSTEAIRQAQDVAARYAVEQWRELLEDAAIFIEQKQPTCGLAGNIRAALAEAQEQTT